MPSPCAFVDIQILQVSTREWDVCDDLNLALASLSDGDVVAEVASAAFDLDAIVQELLKSGQVKDLI